MRTFFTKTEQKMWQRIECGLTIVSANFYTWTIRGGGCVRATGGKNCPLQSGPHYGFIWAYLDVYDSSGTNESQTDSSKFRLKKVRGEIDIWSQVARGEREREREKKKKILLDFLLDVYPTLQMDNS